MKFNAALGLFMAIAITSETKQMTIQEFIAQCKEEELDLWEELKKVEADKQFDNSFRALKEQIENENNSSKEELKINYEIILEEINRANEENEQAMIQSPEYQEAIIMGEDLSGFTYEKRDISEVFPEGLNYVEREMTEEDLIHLEGFILEQEDSLSPVAKMFTEQLLLTTFEKFIESGYLELFKGNRYIRYNELSSNDRLKIGKLLDFSATTQHEFVAEFIKKATTAFGKGETEADRLWSFVDFISFIQEGLDQL